MRRGGIALALLLIALGAYLLLERLRISIPGWDATWPAFPLAGGLTFLGIYLFGKRRAPGHVFLGTALTLAGVAFFFFTLGPLEYNDLDVWWPLFVLIGGVAFIAQWAAAGLRDWGVLLLGLVALVVGSAGLATTLQLLGPETRELLPNLWPAILILLGLMLLLRALFSRRS